MSINVIKMMRGVEEVGGMMIANMRNMKTESGEDTMKVVETEAMIEITGGDQIIVEVRRMHQTVIDIGETREIIERVTGTGETRATIEREAGMAISIREMMGTTMKGEVEMLMTSPTGKEGTWIEDNVTHERCVILSLFCSLVVFVYTLP